MKIACLTGYLDNYEALGLYTVHINKAEFCKRYGYHLEVVRDIREKFKDPLSHAAGFSWSRLEHMADMVESGQFDWVWCVGCDTLITNMRLSFDDIIATDKHVLICGERVAPIQADSFLVRSTLEGIGWLKFILSKYQDYRHHGWVENQAMIDFREQFASITGIVPQHRLNSYDYRRFYHLGNQYRDGTDCYGNRGQWKPGDFLIHWCAASLEERLGFLDFYQTQIVR